MKIGILGAGNVGGNLGQRWTAVGHEVMFGVRDAGNARTQAALEAAGQRACTGTLREAIAYGDVVVYALPWPVARTVLPTLGDFGGKVLIDCSNRFTPPSPDDGPSAAADIARWAPTARVCKAFNTFGAATLLAPQFGALNVSTFVCGDDAAARDVVMQLARDIGLDAVDAGPLANAVWVEALTKLWAQLAGIHGRDIAFRLLRRS